MATLLHSMSASSKRKLVTGEDNASDGGILEQVYWPAHQDWHQGVLSKNSHLTTAQYFEGSHHKISTCITPEHLGSVTDVQVKFLARLALCPSQLPCNEILHIFAQSCKGLEQKFKGWAGWPTIKWWLKAAKAI